MVEPVLARLPPQSSRCSPFLTLPLGLSLTHSHGLTLPLGLLLTHSSRSHDRPLFFRDLTSVPHGLDLSSSHLSGLRSHRRLSLLLAIPPLLAISPSPHACDLTATARPRSLSPTDPAKGHGTPIKLSLSLTPTVKFWSTGCFSFSPYFLSDLVSTGLLVC
uniref:Uncharacterized protein n=1 Tax=Fagus sylvatica TaxID=28930 RepID=A0A2N9HZE7_FAGSY